MSNLEMSGDDLSSHQNLLNKDDKFSINKIITSIHRRKEEEETADLAKKLPLPYLNLVNYQPEPKVVGIIPKDLAISGRVFSFKKEGQNIYLAVSDLTNPQTLKALELLKEQDSHKFIPVLVSKSSMDYLLAIYDVFSPQERVQGDIKITAETQTSSVKAIKDWQTSKTGLSDIPVTQLFEMILASATSYQATDIHIEPEKTAIHLRFRIDNMLQDIVELPSPSLNGIINRIKLLADLKLNIKESSQDGRFSIQASDTGYDIRVSILPTSYGESVVMRLLPQKGKFISLKELGLTGKNAEIVERIIKQPNGLILNTGPTGSGKTTTLYAILNEINSPDKKIITIEDPIEYKLEGISQSQVNIDEDYTFANGLKAILRQDPDVILVGEIRDKETANIAINASLTGHLVLSTLHTNDAAGAIPRLADLGLKPEYFIESILAVIAQRLVRKICIKCAENYTPSEEKLKIISKEIDALPSTISKPTIPAQLKRYNPEKSKGCPVCNGLGYKGVLGIFEILQVNEAITKAVLAGTTIGDIKKLAIENGMITLKQDGLLKVFESITTIEEINRVTGS